MFHCFNRNINSLESVQLLLNLSVKITKNKLLLTERHPMTTKKFLNALKIAFILNLFDVILQNFTFTPKFVL